MASHRRPENRFEDATTHPTAESLVIRRHITLGAKPTFAEDLPKIGLTFDQVTFPGYDIEGLNYSGTPVEFPLRPGDHIVRQDTGSGIATFFNHHADGTTDVHHVRPVPRGPLDF